MKNYVHFCRHYQHNFVSCKGKWPVGITTSHSPLCSNDGAQSERWSKDDVWRVELCVQFECLFWDGDADTEVVLNVAPKHRFIVLCQNIIDTITSVAHQPLDTKLTDAPRQNDGQFNNQ